MTSSDIIIPADYQQQATLESGGATVVRVRGWFSARATVIGGIVGVTIFVRDDDEAAGIGLANIPLTLEGDLASGQILWRYSTQVPIDVRQVEFDIKVKRRLQDSRITLAVASYGQTTLWHYSARALIVGG